MINFGQVLDGGKCESVYTEVVKAGPYGAESTIRDKINGCDPVLGKYAASPSASMALGSLLFMPASVVILLLAIVLSGSVIAAGCNAMFQGLKAIVTLVTGLLPGGGRGFAAAHRRRDRDGPGDHPVHHRLPGHLPAGHPGRVQVRRG